MLLKAVIKWCREHKHAIVILAVSKAVPFYVKHGFEIIEDGWLPLPERWQHKPRVNFVTVIMKP